MYLPVCVAIRPIRATISGFAGATSLVVRLIVANGFDKPLPFHLVGVHLFFTVFPDRRVIVDPLTA